MTKRFYAYLLLAGTFAGCTAKHPTAGHTEITRWQDGKKGALSITYDDGNRNQFKVALPLMERLGLPATFFVITGTITGSKYPGKFIGRPVKDIIRETATVPTNQDNYFERASAAKYLGYLGAFAYYDRSAGLFERDKLQPAYSVMDSLYAAVRSGQLKPGVEYSMEMADEKGLSWDSIKAYAARGYEFSSHTVTHTHLAVLDTPNINYELDKSKADLRDHLGEAYTFDAEIPFGIEHPRAMKYALPHYEALRNLMTDSWLKEINRGHKEHPGDYPQQSYVQWQRGPLTETPYALMTSWIDTTLAHDNIWLVLVIHGVDGLGWKPLSHEELERYFTYIKDREDSLWVATFGEVARYTRERMATQVSSSLQGGKIEVHLSDSLDARMYNMPLTLKTYVPEDWQKVQVLQGSQPASVVQTRKDAKGPFVRYRVSRDQQAIELSKASSSSEE
jgi:peptidoglycan/xylan/chitin deacetylase (PgdA/CDA1 family)